MTGDGQRFSVVINTYNRAHSLGDTLDGLRRQTWQDFEVVVVNGPSTDGTRKLLEEWEGRVRVVDCPEVHLGKSRNLGISAAAGDVVAFIDDDAVPEPDWLEALAEAYDDPGVGGAGGLVVDHTGMDLQYRYSVCSRIGEPSFDPQPPFDGFLYRWSDPFLYLQGTNASFRREALQEIGGFDEEIEYYLDEVEVCLQMIDRGYLLRSLDGAAVHHRYLPSHLRSSKRAWTNPFPPVKNRFYFALSQGTWARTEQDVLGTLLDWSDEVLDAGTRALREQGESDETIDRFQQAVRDGVRIGIERGLRGERRSVEIPDPVREDFLRFPTIAVPERRLRIAFVSGEYPPGDYGGIGRFTADLAEGLAERGHEVHVITRTDGVEVVDIESGVWVHRASPAGWWIPTPTDRPVFGNLEHGAAMYRELVRTHRRRPLDLVSAPVWNSEALLAVLDPQLPTVTSLMTTLRKVVEIHPSWSAQPVIEDLLRLEDTTLEQSNYLHAISQAILEEVRPRSDAPALVLPLGVDDPPGAPGEATSGQRVLFVGRLERRKGVDVLLSALPDLCERFPEAEFVLVGKDTTNTELGSTYREAFCTEHAGNPDLLSRVSFTGPVTEEELHNHYRMCDVFVAPSRYESFGLVLVEAMAWGKPVVGCAAGGMSEIVEGNGFLAEPGDPDSLSDALEELLRKPELRRAMGERSRELFETKWTKDKACERVEAGYYQIAASLEAQPEPGGDSDDRILSERLAELLVDLGLVAPADAADTAAWMLGPAMFESDPSGRLARAASGPMDVWIDNCFQVVLGRSPYPEEYADVSGHVSRTGDRLELIDALAVSTESVVAPSDAGGLRADATNRWLSIVCGALGEADAHGVERVASVAFDLLLHRPPTEGELADIRDRMDGPGRVFDVLDHVASSEEARLQGVNAQLLLDHCETGIAVREREAEMATPGGLKQWIRRLGGRLKRSSVGQRSVALAQRQLAPNDQANAQAISELAPSVAANQLEIAGLRSSIDGAVQRIGGLERRMSAVMDSHRAVVSEMRAVEETISSDIDKLSTTIGAQWDRFEMVRKELMLVARYEGGGTADTEDVEPRVVNPEKLRAQGENLRLNLGAGHIALDDYVNVDSRELPGIDVVASVTDLPFGPGELAEVRSAHLVEHFPIEELRRKIFPYWFELLRPGGTLRSITPDGGAMLEAHARGDMDFDDLHEVLYGGQEYDGDFHFAMFTTESFAQLLREAGFVRVDLVEEARRNGKSLEFEMVATKPDS